jgi:hypothetical protein
MCSTGVKREQENVSGNVTGIIFIVAKKKVRVNSEFAFFNPFED